jgi:cardiolipin synthase
MTARESVLIQTPYFIPDSTFMDACKMPLQAGVDIRIMIPHKIDKPFVHWATLSNLGELLNYGAKVLLYEKGFLHAKIIVVDEEAASVGTFNVDIRSFRLNFEVNTVIYDEVIAKEIHDTFIVDSQPCSELTISQYKKRPFLLRYKETVSRLLSPIL